MGRVYQPSDEVGALSASLGTSGLREQVLRGELGVGILSQVVLSALFVDSPTPSGDAGIRAGDCNSIVCTEAR